MASSSYGAVLTSHLTILLSHLVVPFSFSSHFDGFIFTLYSSNITFDSSFVTFGGFLFFFLTFDSSIVTFSSTNITFDSIFIILSGSFIFFLTFDGSIVTLDSTNITFNFTFVKFNGTLFFFLKFDSYWAVPTSLITVLLSHSIIPPPFFFLALDFIVNYIAFHNICMTQIASWSNFYDLCWHSMHVKPFH